MRLAGGGIELLNSSRVAECGIRAPLSPSITIYWWSVTAGAEAVGCLAAGMIRVPFAELRSRSKQVVVPAVSFRSFKSKPRESYIPTTTIVRDLQVVPAEGYSDGQI